jgi:hypothetical protein
MASTYSSLKIELIGTGDQSGTWGTTTNNNLGDAALGEAITGSADVAFSSADVTVTLTDTNASQAARNLRLNLTGTTGGARSLILGSGCQIEKLYLINNTCADAITVKNTTGTGIAVAAGKSMFVYNNGTNVVEAVTQFNGTIALATGVSGVLPIANGGTGTSSTTFVNAATNVTGTLPIANGGTGATSLAAATIATLGYTTTATAAGTTTLTASSTATQFFTGSTTQTVVLPVASTMTQGQEFTIHNNSTGSLTVNSSGSNLVATVNANTTVTITCILTSGTGAASWDADFTGFTTALPVARGGTGASTLTSNNVLLGAGTSAVTFVAPGTTGNVLTSDGSTWTSAAASSGGTGTPFYNKHYTAGATWTPTSNVKYVVVSITGGGGGGAGNGGNAGGTGGVSSFGSLLTANGGGGGNPSPSSNPGNNGNSGNGSVGTGVTQINNNATATYARVGAVSYGFQGGNGGSSAGAYRTNESGIIVTAPGGSGGQGGISIGQMTAATASNSQIITIGNGGNGGNGGFEGNGGTGGAGQCLISEFYG